LRPGNNIKKTHSHQVIAIVVCSQDATDRLDARQAVPDLDQPLVFNAGADGDSLLVSWIMQKDLGSGYIDISGVALTAGH
jgi:hypothetical protein